jgi:hypothetical protein
MPNSNIEQHFLTINRYKNLNIEIINDIAEYINAEYICLPNKNHKLFKNYENIISQNNYVKPEIAECIYLPCGSCVAIIKTFWIKIIQRMWKKIYAKRQFVLKNSRNFKALKYRELNGSWPCNFC